MNNQPIPSPFSAEQLEQLNQPLDPKRVKHRPGGGGMQLSYLEGHDVINTANQIFGPGRWGFDLLEVEFHNVTDEKGEIVGGYYAARLKLTVAGCIPITEEGVCAYNPGRNPRASIDAADMSRKGAITDALKRAFRCYGDPFGNSLYGSSGGGGGGAKTEGQSRSNSSTRPNPVTPNASNSTRQTAPASASQIRPTQPTNRAGLGSASAQAHSSSLPARPTAAPTTRPLNLKRPAVATQAVSVSTPAIPTANTATAPKVVSGAVAELEVSATAQQQAGINRIAANKGWTVEDLTSQLRQTYGVEELNQLSQAQASELITALQRS